jgi:hypothetical protein
MSSILCFKFRTFNCILLIYFIRKLFRENQNLSLEIAHNYMSVDSLFHCKYTTAYFINDKHIKRHC